MFSLSSARAKTISQRAIFGWRSFFFHPKNLSQHPNLFLRLLLAFILFLSAGIFDGILQQYSDTYFVHNHGSSVNKIPLTDVLILSLPALKSPLPAAIALRSLQLYTLILFAGGYIIRCPWQRLLILKRTFWITGLLYLYHSLTASLTTLPPLSPTCTPLDYLATNTSPSFAELINSGIAVMLGLRRTCTSHIFNEEAMTITSCVLIWWIYSKKAGWKANFAYLHALVAFLLLLCSRQAYTVSVVLSIVITYAVYSLYFFAIRFVLSRLTYAAERNLKERLNGKGLWEKNEQWYQQVAYTPNMMNSGWIAVIAWMDGVDLRWNEVRRMQAWHRVVGNAKTPGVTAEMLILCDSGDYEESVCESEDADEVIPFSPMPFSIPFNLEMLKKQEKEEEVGLLDKF